jgi:hypothetical protein
MRRRISFLETFNDLYSSVWVWRWNTRKTKLKEIGEAVMTLSVGCLRLRFGVLGKRGISFV